MIQFLAEKTANYLAKDCETTDVEVLKYGYYLLYQEWLVKIGALLIALPFGLFFHVLTSIVAFILIRRCAMGAHAKYPIVCRIVTYTIWFGPAILSEFFFFRLTIIHYVGLYIFGAVSLFLYAPAETDVKKVPNQQMRKHLKIEAIAWLSFLFLVAAVIQGIFPATSFIIVTTATLACCMVHPWMYWINGFDPVTREVRG
ncbi:MAG: accessory gene regulator B family protein [Defluviitaleaceae bacterium]|nr:accessory gene regulator B family protein [Defluviitaleaceae bacterium]